MVDNLASSSIRNKNKKMHVPPVPSLSLGDEAKLLTSSLKELATVPSKTPVSILQELLSRRGNTPKYELVQIEGPIHEPVFRYRVFLNSDFMATGAGRSKKDAKHAAAQNLLDLFMGNLSLEEANVVSSNGTAVSEKSNSSSSKRVVSPFDNEVMGNPIGWLQEMCMSRRWPPPFYKMEHEEGLPHERLFTMACTVLNHTEVGSGKSKKLAKRTAAYKMWKHFQDKPNDTSGVEKMFESGEKLEDVKAHYASLKDSKIQTVNNQQSLKVSQFHKALKQNSGDKLNELQNMTLEDTDFNYVEFLQSIAAEQQFEVSYIDIEEKTRLKQYQCLVQLSTLPVAVCHGSGPTSKDAQSNAARYALEYLKIMTKK